MAVVVVVVVVCKECNAHQERARLFARMHPAAAVNEMSDFEQDGMFEPRKEAQAHCASDLDSQPREADTHQMARCPCAAVPLQRACKIWGRWAQAQAQALA
jgi:hypothetical protein